MANVMLEIRRFFFGMRSDVPALIKVRVFANDFELRIVENQILFNIIFIDHPSRCKLKVYMITHTKERPSATN